MTTLDASGSIRSGNLYSPNKSDALGTLTSPAGGYAAGLVDNNVIATDGLNRIWYGNQTADHYIGVMDSSGNALAPNGYEIPLPPSRGTPYNDIDPSGNVWLATLDGYIVEFVGIAAPVVRPLSTAVATNSFGVRP